MFKHLFATSLRSTAGRRLGACLSFSLVLLALSSIRQSRINTPGSAGNSLSQVQREQVVNQKETMPATRQMTGAAARKYLQEPGEGQSLMQAITAARFGLKSQERGPFGEPGSGYLGMSHEQNLNAWFAEDGVTVRPTVAEEERARAWHLEMRLKAYGYGTDLVAAPPIVSQHVKDNRIEYERAGDFKFQISNFKFEKDSLFQSAIDNSTITEWYENRAEGIEQGFTISSRPEHKTATVSGEPLRLVISLSGDLRAQVKDTGRSIELTDRRGTPALSYSKLTAVDAAGKQLAARMETSADGREIALVVDERGATYPITIDPIAASLEKILDAGPRQNGAQFGDAVAIDGDKAIVGAWLTDLPYIDCGSVFLFSRAGSNWNLLATSPVGLNTKDECGYSVAISGTRAAYGCAGAGSNTGRAFFIDLSRGLPTELIPVELGAGDMYGASVAISGNRILVGAPGFDFTELSNAGKLHLFTLDSAGNPGSDFTLAAPWSGETQLGASVALDSNTIIAGAPGSSAGAALIVTRDPSLPVDFFTTVLHPNDGATGDLFGTGVAISNNTVVIGAAGNDQKGTDAGAAYVFVRTAGEQWSQQQKLTAGDGKANDIFSYNAVAIEGNTIVVGARRQDLTSSNPGDNSGAAYIFTRSGTVWSQQTKLSAGGFYRAPGDEFGTSVGISRDTVIVSAPHEAAASDGTANAGVSYVYRLDCVPPSNRSAASFDPLIAFPTASACPGNARTLFIVDADGTAPKTYQWQKNGIIIPGATSLTFALSNISAADAGTYDVITSNSCGSATSRPVILTVHTFSLSPNPNFSAAGSPGIVGVTSTGSCGYTSVSNTPFITITSGATGTAPANVGFNVAANTGPSQRTGTITIANKTFTVTQDGLNCSYSIAPTAPNFSASGNTAAINITATAGCAWTAISNDNWLTITSGSSGSGNGVANYLVAANTGPARTGTFTVAGQTVTVTQASGCTFALSPTAQNFPASIAAGAVNVTSGAGCAWSAVSNAAFISVTSGASDSGNGTVGYSLTANDVSSQRSGTLTIAGQTFTVTQDGATLNAVQFSSANYNVQEDCTTVTITVNRIGDTSGPATVDYKTSDVTATERKDYITALGSLRFAAGETSRSFSVLINEDSFVEGNESFSITLSNPSGVTVGGPAIATVTIADDASESAANAIDDPQTYVCQHYHDFLNRQPDAAGLQFWTNQITSCGTDQACSEARRINVSASFFLSIEFQDTGYLVERIYKAAYGDAAGNSTFPSSHQLPVPVVRLNEFLSDTQEIGLGVIVGQGNWQQQIENNKQAFTASFVQRSRFTSAFPLSMTAAQFVDTLNANAGNPLSSSERNQLVTDLSTNAKTRGQVLRAVAEDTDLNNVESNRAFVLMQYFGYLRRNPNDPQDSDHTGYDFWLTKLNQFNGNYINAEMVRAFITSIEYRQRFGQQ